MTRKEKLNKFIEDNNIEFSSGNRNTPSVILSGFALFIGYKTITNLLKDIDSHLDADDMKELTRVFEYANTNHYGEFWKTEEAQAQYTF